MIISLAVVYFAVCVVGHFVVAAAMSVMRRLVFKRWPVFSDWSVFFLGSTERAIALTLVLWAPSYLPPFVGGWVVLKLALGWQREKETSKVLTDSMLALVGSVLSFGVAIGVGAYINPNAIHVWAPH